MIRAEMSAAAMQVVTLPSAIEARARANVQRERYRAWRRQVENFRTATGARFTLVDVPEEVWRAGFSAEADPCSVVVDQLTAYGD